MKILKLVVLLAISLWVVAASDKISAQERPSEEGAVLILTSMIKNVDAAIQNLDSIIERSMKRKMILMNLRARLEMAREMEKEKEETLELRGLKGKVFKWSGKKVKEAYEKYKEAKETIDRNTREAEERLKTIEKQRRRLEKIYPRR